MNDHDLDWLEDARPVAGVRPDAERDARVALVRHLTKPAPALRPIAAAHTPRPTSRVARRRRIVASALVSVAAVAAVFAATTGGGSRSPIGTPAADAAPLVRLSAKIASAPDPTGDATLVIRRQTYPASPEIDGYDLYTDDGRYFYGATRAELAHAAGNDEDIGDGSFHRELLAATAAIGAPIDEARHQMAIAPLDPNASQDDSGAVATQRDEQIIAAKRKAGADVQLHPMTPRQHEDGMIWSNGMDALIAGAGRPDVRAGVLLLYSTVPEITVEQTTTDGAASLTLTSHVFPDGYQEQLVIDASTGIPLGFTGGYPGKTPSVTVAYDVTRTTVAAVSAS
jgi:hypothetical protein